MSHEDLQRELANLRSAVMELASEVGKAKKEVSRLGRREFPAFEPWTDYSATSTVTGWASFTTKHIYYKRIGKLVFVAFFLDGTSDATSASFTLPYALAAAPAIQTPIRTRDNTGSRDTGALTITAGASTVNLQPTAASVTWTASGTKEARGQFCYVMG